MALHSKVTAHKFAGIIREKVLFEGESYMRKYSTLSRHTPGLDTIFVQIYMDPSTGVPGVSKDAPGSTKRVI